MTNNKLFLIDGHALIFKMYYAFLRRPMINSKGVDTSILFGFTKRLLELIEKEGPTHLAVSFDLPGGTFRNEMFPAYKANRSETPQLVIDALEPLTEICKALNIPVIAKQGFEADDVIGSVAKYAEKEGFTVYMVTPDKDYGQLIDDNIYQYKPGKSGGDCEIIGKKEICEKYGISDPLQVIDMLTICGDTADNVPGVKGVGEVGAGKLISKYGSVENIYAHLDELSARQQEQFREAQSHIELSHTLVTIKTDIPMDIPCDQMRIDTAFSPEIADLFAKYEFTSLRRFIAHVRTSDKSSKAKSLKIKKIDKELLLQYAKNSHCCSIITDSADKSIFSKINGITLATLESPADGIGDCCEETVFVCEGKAGEFKQLLENESVTKCGYDLKLQSNILAYNGISLKGKLMDIELTHYLINPEMSHSLDILARSYLDINLDTASQSETSAVTGSLFDDSEISEQVSHQNDDSDNCAAILFLSRKLRDELESGKYGEKLTELYDSVEEPLIRVLARMERNGVKVDLRQLDRFAEQLREEMAIREDSARELAGDPSLNVSSPKQIGTLLFDKFKLDPKAKKNKTGSYTTDEATLSALADKHPIINEILEFRAVKKLLSTYIEPFPSYISPLTGRVHTTFNQALTATGRLSSSNPNLQNIPIRTERGREIRKSFVPGTPDGLILSADYSQIELRIMAHLSLDAHLTEAFKNGIDVHSATASKIFGLPHGEVTQEQRRIAKTVNFGIIYGISAFGLGQRLGISRKEAQKIIDDYFANFPAVHVFIEDTIASARENGYVETLLGRRRYLPDINSKNVNAKLFAERNAVNAPIQGTAADIIKLAMIGVDRRMSEEGLKSKMVLQVHDELVFDTLKEEAEQLKSIVKEEMENVTELSVPLIAECGYGKNWLEAH